MTMVHFPNVCIDNFFKQPEEIIKYADSLEYFNDPNGNFPGQRSKALHQLNLEFHSFVCSKYLRCFYTDDQIKHQLKFKSTSYFQKIGKDSGNGWIHSDDLNLHTQIVYLSPNASLEEGTSLFVPNSLVTSEIGHEIKKKFYLKEIDYEEAEKHRIANNERFTETVRFANVYNRCIGFDASQWHSANRLDQGERLTLITFWEEITGPQTGLQRINMGIL